MRLSWFGVDLSQRQWCLISICRNLPQDLVVEKPEAPTKDQLVAVFRTAEGPRWAWLLDRSVWERVVKHSDGI